MKEKGSALVNPIYWWTDTDIWEYIKLKNLVVNPLYSKGYDRVGCIGCPLASYKQRVKEFNDFPKYKTMYINAFEKMIMIRNEKKGEKETSWRNGVEVFEWWMDETKHNIKGQMSIFD